MSDGKDMIIMSIGEKKAFSVLQLYQLFMINWSHHNETNTACQTSFKITYTSVATWKKTSFATGVVFRAQTKV